MFAGDGRWCKGTVAEPKPCLDAHPVVALQIRLCNSLETEAVEFAHYETASVKH